MKFSHSFELRDKDLNIALLFSCRYIILILNIVLQCGHRLIPQTCMNRMVLLQKKIIRIISKKPFDAHTDLACERETFPIILFKSLQILKLSEIRFFQVEKFMYSYKIGLLLNVFREMFSMTNQVHSYNTKNSNTFYLFRARTNRRLFGIRFQGPEFLKSLNNNIQSAATISLFNSRLKTFLLS